MVRTEMFKWCPKANVIPHNGMAKRVCVRFKSVIITGKKRGVYKCDVCGSHFIKVAGVLKEVFPFKVKNTSLLSFSFKKGVYS
jgi:hypothetical protein